MKKIIKMLGLALLGLSASSLVVGCGPTESYTNDDVKSIAINEKTFNNNWDFTLNQTVNYSSLQIDLLDSSDKVLDTLSYTENKNSITYTEIDTSKLATGLEFTVTYTDSDGKKFNATHEYDVVETNYILTNWGASVAYSEYQELKNAALDKQENLLTNGELDYSKIKTNHEALVGGSNIKSDGKFYVANHNAVRLSPQVYGLSAEDLTKPDVSPVPINELPEDMTLTISSQSAKENLDVEDYFDEGGLEKALNTGLVDFKDDLTGLETDVTLTFSCSLGSSFPSISLDVTIVDGWNITDAKELVLFDNAKSTSYHGYSSELCQSYVDLKNEVLGTTNATSTTSFENFVLFNNVSIGADDLPTGLIWSKDDEESTNYLNGSLKDWHFIYEHNVGKEWDNLESDSFNFYGNYNQLSLGDDFPWVLSERSDYGGHQNDEEKPTKIDTHTTLFGSDQDDFTQNQDYQYNFVDFSAIGNQGVAENQLVDINGTPENEDDDVVGGGVLFGKFRRDLNYNNCNINSFFTVNVTQGETSVNNISNEYQIAINVNDSKISNCYSSMFFNYGESDIYVNRSILTEAGGPLVINQAIPYNDPNSGFQDVDPSDIQGTNFFADDTSILLNVVTGQGGWFDIYGASSSIAMIRQISDGAFKKEKYTLFTDRGDGETGLNLVGISMCIHMESAGALKPGMHSRIAIGGRDYINYGEGGEDQQNIQKALLALSGGDMTQLPTLVNLLTNTPYGSQLLLNFASSLGGQFAAAAQLPLFTTYDASGNRVISSLQVTDPSNLENSSLTTLDYYLNLAMGNQTSPSIPDNFGNLNANGSNYIGAYVQLAGAATNNLSTYNVSPRIDQTQLITRLAQYLKTYKGSTSYGVVMELFDLE